MDQNRSHRSAGFAPLRELKLRQVRMEDRFWDGWISRNRSIALDHQYRYLIETGRIDNLRKAAGELPGRFKGMIFNDSDVYKWIEAVSYAMIAEDRDDGSSPTDELATRVDRLVTLIDEA